MIEAEALAFFAGCQQERTHGGGLSDTDGRYGSLYVAHRVEDRHTGCNHAAGGINVEMDVFISVFGFEKQKLGDNQVGDVIIDATTQKNYAFFEQARIYVILALTASGLLNYYRDIHESPFCNAVMLRIWLSVILQVTRQRQPR